MILNLVDLEKSDIKYIISKFPDGQQDLVLVANGGLFGADGSLFNLNRYIVDIHSRFNSFKDLELIICAVKACRRLKVKTINLYIPYLLGARSDRQFQQGGNSYLVDVIAPIINSLEFNKVTVIDVHSDVAAACIKNLEVVDNHNLVKFVLDDLSLNKVRFISPDAGSEKKIFKLLEKFDTSNSIIITCSKHRDTKGHLSNTIVPVTTGFGNSDFVIIDDICDGGRTFINISNYIKKEFILTGKVRGSIYLIVTHGIFSQGFKELGLYFDKIYCTNSVRDIGDLDGNDLIKTNVKQFKVI